MNKEKLISKMLCLPPTAIEYHISQRLAKFFPDKALIAGDGRAGKCAARPDGQRAYAGRFQIP